MNAPEKLKGADLVALAHELWAMAQGPRSIEDAANAMAERLASALAAVPQAGEPACPDCNGAGEVFAHADDCHDDLCALNGDMHSCAGRVEPCGCRAALAPIQATGAPEPAGLVDRSAEMQGRSVDKSSEMQGLASPAVQQEAEDAARLDWLVGQGNCVVNEGTSGFWLCWIDENDPNRTEYQKGSYPTARDAIDAARAASSGRLG